MFNPESQEQLSYSEMSQLLREIEELEQREQLALDMWNEVEGESR